MHQDRASYFQIKRWLLENYWDSCRDHGPQQSKKGKEHWTLEQIASDVYDGYAGGDGSLDSPLEYLMLEVVSLVLSCWYPAQAKHHKDRIYSLLSENNLEKMLEGIPNDEIDEFCSGLMKPDTHLGENARQIEVSDDQTTPYLFR